MARVASLLAVAVLSVVPLQLVQCGDAGSNEPASSRMEAGADWVVEPRVLDFGRYSSCNPPGPLAVRIANRGSVPLAVGGWSSSCRCVVATFGGVTEIPPGDVLDVAVTLTPWGMPGPHGHDLDLMLGRPPEAARVRIAYRMDPEVSVARELASRKGNPEGLVRIETNDGGLVKVLSLDPPIPVVWPEAAGEAVEFEIPWDLLDRIARGEPVDGLGAEEADAIRSRMRRRADGSWRGLWVRATLEHAVCDSVSIPRSNDRPVPFTEGETATAPVAPPLLPSPR
ncbi:MAG: hypothetical protein ACYTFH_00920 [Planctomycetota bacterium]|jgi:hypothetical protein